MHCNTSSIQRLQPKNQVSTTKPRPDGECNQKEQKEALLEKVNFTTRPDILKFIVNYFDATGCYFCLDEGDEDQYSIYYKTKDGGSECGWVYDREDYIEVELGCLEEIKKRIQLFDYTLDCCCEKAGRFLYIYSGVIAKKSGGAQ